MNERETHKTEGTNGEAMAREAASAKTTGMASAGMSSGWSAMWDSTALDELRMRKAQPQEDGKDEGAGKTP